MSHSDFEDYGAPPAGNFHQNLSFAAHDATAIELPSSLIFSGMYERRGSDLVVSRPFESVTIHDYFTSNARQDLVAPDGAILRSAEVLALSHDASGAHLAASQLNAKAIGRVESVSGMATATRNGQSFILHTGDLFLKGDAIETHEHGTIAVVLIDGSAFVLSEGARIVLDNMVYSPGSSANSALLNLVQGSISFIAGDVAHTGKMNIETPAATMDIRADAVHADVDARDGKTRFSAMEEPDGRVGKIGLLDNHDLNHVLGTVSDGGVALSLEYDNGQLHIDAIPKTLLDLRNEQTSVDQVLQIFQFGQQYPLSLQLHQMELQQGQLAHGSSYEPSIVGATAPDSFEPVIISPFSPTPVVPLSNSALGIIPAPGPQMQTYDLFVSNVITPTDSDTIINSVTIEPLNVLAGTLNLVGSTIANASIVVANGALIEGVGTLAASTTIANAGIIEALGGTLDVAGTLTGAGSLAIAFGAGLELAAGNSEAVTFLAGPVGANGASTLRLDAPATFTSTIAGINGNHDVLDLVGLNVSGLLGTLQTTATTGAGSYNNATGITTLTISDPSLKETLPLKLVGDYSNSTWTVTSDGRGGIDVIDPPAPSVGGKAILSTHVIPTTPMLVTAHTDIMSDATVKSLLATHGDTFVFKANLSKADVFSASTGSEPRPGDLQHGVHAVSVHALAQAVGEVHDLGGATHDVHAFALHQTVAMTHADHFHL